MKGPKKCGWPDCSREVVASARWGKTKPVPVCAFHAEKSKEFVAAWNELMDNFAESIKRTRTRIESQQPPD